jgi:hypothetical protein
MCVTRRADRRRYTMGCAASCRTASCPDSGFSLPTCAECYVATYRISIGCGACFGLTTLHGVARGALSNCSWLRHLLWSCDFARSGTWQRGPSVMHHRDVHSSRPQLTGTECNCSTAIALDASNKVCPHLSVPLLDRSCQSIQLILYSMQQLNPMQLIPDRCNTDSVHAEWHSE